MQLLRVSKPNSFDDVSEMAMDTHVAHMKDRLVLIIGARVAFAFDDAINSGIDRTIERLGSWLEILRCFNKVSVEESEGRLGEWLKGLPETGELQPLSGETYNRFIRPNVMHLILGPHTTNTPPPAPPSPIYGHLPFQATTDPNDVVHRWEAFPTSRRLKVGATSGAIAHGTFAAPHSELPLVPSGFAAVARYALPGLAPACFRYDLHPATGTPVDCGASVPLYGQAGGGVEIHFPLLSDTSVAIAAPTPIPAL